MRDPKSAENKKPGSSPHARPNLVNQYVSPRTDTEKVIVSVWEEILGLAPVGIHDKFFDLGGHSLLAIEMAMELEERFPCPVSVNRVFDAPTVAELALQITDDLETALLKVKGVASIEKNGYLESEIQIKVDPIRDK